MQRTRTGAWATVLVLALLPATAASLMGCPHGGKDRKKTSRTGVEEGALSSSSGTGEKHGQAPEASASGPDDGQDPGDVRQGLADRPLDPGQVEMQLADGSRWVDLARASGLWVVRDRQEAADHVAADVGGLQGMGLGDDPLILRLSAADVAGRCVHVLAAAAQETELRIGRVGTRGQRMQLDAGPTVSKWMCFEEDAGEVDVRVETASQAVLAGLWLAPPESTLPEEPPSPGGCGKDRKGITLVPGTAVAVEMILSPGESVHVRAPGKATRAGHVTVKVQRDGAEAETLELGGDVDSAPYENPDPAPRAVRVVASLAPESPADVCVSLASPLPSPVAMEQAPETPDAVVLVMTDTMRADLYPDRGGAFGVAMKTLASLTDRSTVFTSATAHSSYTKPSVGTILTGVYPDQHGGLGRKAPISGDVQMVTQLLSLAGVRTVGFLSNFFFNPTFGMRRGWSEDLFIDPYQAAMDDTVVLDELEKWCDQGVPEGPLFVYVHLMGAHAPYAPPREFRKEYLGGGSLMSRIVPRHTAKLIADLTAGREKKLNRRETDQMRGLYRADAAYHDAIMERLLSILDESGLWDRALVIYTSDHGEEFYEHGRIGHGTGLWFEQVSIPLLIHGPGQDQGLRVGTTVGHVDILPTVLSTLGVPVPAHLPGRSLLSVATEADRHDRPLLMQSWIGWWGVQAGPFKLLRRPAGEKLFVVSAQGEEEIPQSDHPVLHTLMRRHLARLLKEAGTGAEQVPDQVLDDELEEKLEQLGYVMQ